MSEEIFEGPGAGGSGDASASPPPSILEVEQHSIEHIPAEHRTASPLNLFRLEFGTANTFPVVVFGSFPVLVFGLSFWQGLLATLLGVVVGAAILMFMALFGPITGTNNSVASGAHFGIVGRLVGSLLSLLTAVTFFTLSVLTSGDVLVGALDKLLGTGQPNWLLAASYAFFAVLVLIICLYGFQFMLKVNELNAVTATVLYVLGIVAFAGAFDLGYQGTAGSSGANVVPTFIAATLFIAANPLSFGAFLGDWTRYIPEGGSKLRLMGAAFGGQLATLLPLGFGLATGTVIVERAASFSETLNYSGGLVEIAPTWYLGPILIIAVIGGLGAGSSALYGPGLDFSSIFPRFTRFQSTLLIGVASIVIVFVARFGANFVETITTFATLIVACNIPWIVIMAIGLFVRRGWYSSDDLQVFNRGERGGIYWFRRGVNWRATSSWSVSVVVALMFVNLPGQFEGPLRDLAPALGMAGLAGVDLSLLVALVLPAVLYPCLLFAFPEPRYAFGPEGSRWVPTSAASPTPITPVKEPGETVDVATRPAPEGDGVVTGETEGVAG